MVLAGGGSGGHVYPLLAFADCLRRHQPDLRITCVGGGEGPGERAHPGGRVRAAPGAGVPAAPLGQPGPGQDPDPDAALDAGRPGGARRRRRRRRGRLRRLRGGAGLPGRVAPAHPDRDPRAERPARAWRTGSACASPSTSRSASRTSPQVSPLLKDARVVGVPLRPAITTLDRAGEPGRGPRALRAGPATGRPCSCSAPRRARARSTSPWPARPRRSPRPGSRCCT